MNKEKLKEKYMEYQMMIQQVQQLHQNIENLEKHIHDISKLDENLDSISKVKPENETLMALGSGIFMKGILKDNKKLIMNVGSGVCVEKTVEEARETVKKQLNEVSILSQQMKEQANAVIEVVQELQKEFEKIKSEE
ncbi:MAG TPA: prefoldin subunit alpha [Candidatus Nanoarchaeia archaeon]|nr:prefoldin subunit alpha [Candidatus Nanoarchaeia archaeon]